MHKKISRHSLYFILEIRVCSVYHISLLLLLIYADRAIPIGKISKRKSIIANRNRLFNTSALTKNQTRSIALIDTKARVDLLSQTVLSKVLILYLRTETNRYKLNWKQLT